MICRPDEAKRNPGPCGPDGRQRNPGPPRGAIYGCWLSARKSRPYSAAPPHERLIGVHRVVVRVGGCAVGLRLACPVSGPAVTIGALRLVEIKPAPIGEVVARACGECFEEDRDGGDGKQCDDILKPGS